MGQGTSFLDPSYTAGRLQQNLTIIHRMAHMDYEEFLKSVKELNEITHSFTDHRGKQLHFVVKRGTSDTIMWKGTVRIRCIKANSITKKVDSVRLLTLRQYVAMYKEITEQVSNLSSTQTSLSSIPRDITASTIFHGMNEEVVTDTDTECCICMDRKSEIILACSHEFCEICIDSWHVSHNTCPLCRSTVGSTDDTWVITEKPTSADYDTEVKGYLVGLADRKGPL